MIYVRFIADNSIESKLIQWRALGRCSHVEYVIAEPGKPTVTFGARLQGGITHRLIDYCKPTFEEWYTFAGIEESYDEALAFDGRKYDIGDIAALAIGRHPATYDPEHLICSCFVGYSNRRAWANGRIPVPLINPNALTWEMTPPSVYSCVTQMVKIA